MCYSEIISGNGYFQGRYRGVVIDRETEFRLSCLAMGLPHREIDDMIRDAGIALQGFTYDEFTDEDRNELEAETEVMMEAMHPASQAPRGTTPRRAIMVRRGKFDAIRSDRLHKETAHPRRPASPEFDWKKATQACFRRDQRRKANMMAYLDNPASQPRLAAAFARILDGDE